MNEMETGATGNAPGKFDSSEMKTWNRNWKFLWDGKRDGRGQGISGTGRDNEKGPREWEGAWGTGGRELKL